MCVHPAYWPHAQPAQDTRPAHPARRRALGPTRPGGRATRQRPLERATRARQLVAPPARRTHATKARQAMNSSNPPAHTHPRPHATWQHTLPPCISQLATAAAARRPAVARPALPPSRRRVTATPPVTLRDGGRGARSFFLTLRAVTRAVRRSFSVVPNGAIFSRRAIFFVTVRDFGLEVRCRA